MNSIANKQAVCDCLCRAAETDRDIVVLCSDSRGSASMAEFAQRFPQQFVETGIAEQNLVSVAAGLALCGKKPVVASPASFLSTRSLEQIKVDVAYTGANVKLLGVSGGVSYGPLGLTHHSTGDIAALCALPGMRVFLPSDRFCSEWLFEALMADGLPAYIRVGRNAVEDIHDAKDGPFEMGRAVPLREGNNAALIACGEMVAPALAAAQQLEAEGISCAVYDMYCLKPFDAALIGELCETHRPIVTVEEHCPSGGLGALASQVVAEVGGTRVHSLSLPDAPVVTGKSADIFRHYGLDAEGIAAAVRGMLP